MMKTTLFLLVLSLLSFAESVDLETFEKLSASIKNKQNVLLLDETPLKVIPQYTEPQRKMQTNSELSESSLSAE